jgi:small multidrug resistance family-3 protein
VSVLAKTAAIYVAAASAEIGGCFAFWAWLRLGRPAGWAVAGMAALALFAWLLTLSPASFAGRAYAAYGGVYIAASLAWLWAVEGLSPDRFDLFGAALCLAGAGVIVLASRPG